MSEQNDYVEYTQAEVDIPHEAVLTMYNDGSLRLGIADNVARKLAEEGVTSRISPVRAAFVFWNFVVLIVLVGSIVSSFIYKWWYFIAGFVISTIIAVSNRKSNAQNFARIGIVDSEFYELIRRYGSWIYLIHKDVDVWEYRK